MMDISIPITRTKLIIPRRRGELLSRPRLLSVLEESIDNRLIIVAAPAGYGKTSLLVDFVNQTLQPVCWLALDDLDKDPQRFIAHFIASMNAVFPEFGKSCMPALQGMSQARLNLDALVSLVVNDIYETITEHFLFVLDDYHLVEDTQDINYFINRFLMMVDENCHMVISSRRLLPLSDMPLLVARSTVGGLGFEDLAFRMEEIQSLYLQNHRIILNEADASNLAALTEGWITGLVLSTEIKNGRVTTRFQAKHVAGVSLYDYLAQQVLEHQTDEVKLFLFRSSLLDEFDVDRCEKVIGAALNMIADWQMLMDTVQRNNLFTLPVIEDRIWLRYHHLFRDFLQAQMSRLYPDETRLILFKLAEYFQEQLDWERAYQVCERIGDKELTARLIERAGQFMITQGRLLTVHDWLEKLPTLLVDESAIILSIYGAVMMMLGDPKAGIQFTGKALALLKVRPDNEIAVITHVRRSTAFRLAGNLQQALEDAEEAIRLSDGTSLSSLLAGAYHAKGSVLYQSGKLVDALDWLQKARVLYQNAGHEQGATKVALDIGGDLQYLGRFAEAEQTYLDVLAYYQSTGNVVWQANLLNNVGVVHFLVGEYEKAFFEFEQSIQYARLGGYQRLEAYALTSLGDLFRDLKSMREAEDAYAKAAEIDRQIDDQFLHFYLQYTNADLALGRKSIRKAEEALEDAMTLASDANSPYQVNLCGLLRGKIAFENNDFETAVFEFGKAMEFFAQEGHHIEANRCRILSALATAASGQFTSTRQILENLSPIIQNPELTHLLMSESRSIEKALNQKSIPEDLSMKFSGLLSQVSIFEQKLPGIRKQIRRQSQVVRLAPPELVFLTFGKIQIKIGDHTITGAEWMSQNARDLLLLLLMHPEGLTKEEIGEIFWPDSTPSELKLRFKNTIYRLRHAAGKDAVLFEDELYLFNRGMDYEADYENFNQHLAAARRAVKINERIKYLTSAVKLYKGYLLPELSDHWVTAERERYHQMAMDAMMQLAELQLQQGELDQVITTSQLLLNFDPTYEPMVCLVMRAQSAKGNTSGVVQAYDALKQILREELDAKPSPGTVTLFHNLTRERRTVNPKV